MIGVFLGDVDQRHRDRRVEEAHDGVEKVGAQGAAVVGQQQPLDAVPALAQLGEDPSGLGRQRRRSWGSGCRRRCPAARRGPCPARGSTAARAWRRRRSTSRAPPGRAGPRAGTCSTGPMISSWAPIVLAVRAMAKNGSLVGTITGLTGLPACSARLTTAVKSWRSWSVIVGVEVARAQRQHRRRHHHHVGRLGIGLGQAALEHRQVVRRADRHQLAVGLGQIAATRTLSCSACFWLNCSRCSC